MKTIHTTPVALGSALVLLAACGVDSARQYYPGSGHADPESPADAAPLPAGEPGPGRVPQVCAGDSCTLSCPKGTALCGGSCVDVFGDAQHCGACGNVCSEGQGCRDGNCNRHAWSETLHGEHVAEVSDVAVAADGSIVAVGSFSGTLELDGASRTSEDASDGFLWHMAADGQLAALQLLSGKGNQEPLAVAVDERRRVAVVGRFDGAMRIGDMELESSAGTDAFVALLSPDGQALWAARFGDAGAIHGTTGAPEVQQAVAVAFDSRGDLIVAGSFFGSVDLGGEHAAASQGEDTFVAKLTGEGELAWAKTVGGAGSQVVQALAIDALDEIAIAGWFTHELPLGAGALAAQGGSDAFVARLASDGSVLWYSGYGDASAQVATSVAIDPVRGDVLVAGGFEGRIDLGGGPIDASNGGYEIFVARLAGDGRHQASAAFIGDGSQLPSDLAVTKRGETLLVGSYSGALDFGGGPMVASAYGDAFVARLDRELNGKWSYRYTGRGAVLANAVAAHGDLAIVGGSYELAVALGGPTLIAAPQGAFVAALQP